MAGRAFQDKAFSLDRKRVTLTAVIDFGASGAPTLKDWIPSGAGREGSYGDATAKGTRGVKSVTKNATGDYTIQLQDQYQRLLGVEHTFLNSKATSEAAPIMRVITDDTDMRADGGATVNVLFRASGAAANPGNGERVLITIQLDDSSSR